MSRPRAKISRFRSNEGKVFFFKALSNFKYLYLNALLARPTRSSSLLTKYWSWPMTVSFLSLFSRTAMIGDEAMYSYGKIFAISRHFWGKTSNFFTKFCRLMLRALRNSTGVPSKTLPLYQVLIMLGFCPYMPMTSLLETDS